MGVFNKKYEPDLLPVYQWATRSNSVITVELLQIQSLDHLHQSFAFTP